MMKRPTNPLVRDAERGETIVVVLGDRKMTFVRARLNCGFSSRGLVAHLYWQRIR